MKVYVRSYSGTRNLGDVIQTYALCRLLPDVTAWPGSKADSRPFVVNGWLGRRPFDCRAAVFAGVFVKPMKVEWFDLLARYAPIGARDPATQAILQERAIPAAMIGCATLTLPRYHGPRMGVLRIDDGTPGCLTNWLPRDLSWESQWNQAIARLEQLRRAALVLTTRLHVVLPCLAFGTPVSWHHGGDDQLERFSILDAMGLMEGIPVTLDVGPWASQYKSFLGTQLNIALEDREPAFPAIIARH